ncbi:hypothetical protein BC567DRAFT_60062 [Phyllosticta citribraziliensis]
MERERRAWESIHGREIDSSGLVLVKGDRCVHTQAGGREFVDGQFSKPSASSLLFCPSVSIAPFSCCVLPTTNKVHPSPPRERRGRPVVCSGVCMRAMNATRHRFSSRPVCACARPLRVPSHPTHNEEGKKSRSLVLLVCFAGARCWSPAAAVGENSSKGVRAWVRAMRLCAEASSSSVGEARDLPYLPAYLHI